MTSWELFVYDYVSFEKPILTWQYQSQELLKVPMQVSSQPKDQEKWWLHEGLSGQLTNWENAKIKAGLLRDMRQESKKRRRS